MKKINKKIINIFLVMILLVSSTGIWTNESKAATYIISEAELYSKTQIISFKYKGNPIAVEFVVYKKDGVEYPAYCLNRNQSGVTIDQEYQVNVEKEIENTAIWKVIVNGYPFKTPNELGCNTKLEAYCATKMAVYDVLYNYDWNDFSPMLEAGERAIKAAEKIAKTAEQSTQTRPTAKIEIINDKSEWEIDKENPNYVSRTYQVKTNVKSTKYSVSLDKTNLETILVTGKDGNERNEFKEGEIFKISIPIIDLEKDDNFEIKVTADMETWPILYGETPGTNIQDYALTAGYISYEDSKLIQKYYKNKTKIEIIKKDTETGIALQGAKFRILNENKEEVYNGLQTNQEGKIAIENILPGKYYIEEIKPPDGYTGYEELIEVELKLNQTYTVNVNNYKKLEEEEKNIEDKEVTVTGEKEISLPRTGF